MVSPPRKVCCPIVTRNKQNRNELFKGRVLFHTASSERVSRQAPAAWREPYGQATNVVGYKGFEPSCEAVEGDSAEHKQASARLFANIYEIDPFVCPGVDQK